MISDVSCPLDITIGCVCEITKLEDKQYILTGKKDAITSRIAYHWDIPKAKAAECIGCRKCERQCTQHLPIVERLAEIAALPDIEE